MLPLANGPARAFAVTPCDSWDVGCVGEVPRSAQASTELSAQDTDAEQNHDAARRSLRASAIGTAATTTVTTMSSGPRNSDPPCLSDREPSMAWLPKRLAVA